MKDNFSIDDALAFIKEKEGKDFPLEYKFVHRPDLLEERDLVIDGNLSLREQRKLKKLPDGLIVTKNLSVFRCRNLERLPSNLYVGASLVLDFCSSLEALPDNLYVGDSLSIWKCNSIRDFPKNMFVGNSLHMESDDFLVRKFNGDIKAMDEYATSLGCRIGTIHITTIL